MSRSDVLIAIGAPVLGVIGIVVGLTADDATLLVLGIIGLALGLLFAIPLLRSRDR